MTDTDQQLEVKLERVLEALSYASVKSQYVSPVTSPYDIGYEPHLVDKAKAAILALIQNQRGNIDLLERLLKQRGAATPTPSMLDVVVHELTRLREEVK